MVPAPIAGIVENMGLGADIWYGARVMFCEGTVQPKLDLIRLTPGIFQERVEKAYELRVTVVGSQIFAVKIDSQKNRDAQLDWRRALHNVGYAAVELPHAVEEKILAFMRTFGLFYGAFDFIVTPGGRYVFLEINPSGQYMWLECAADLGITTALADALMEPCV